MHPEYPCAHCIVAHAAGTVMQAFFGSNAQPAFTLTTPTAPGVTHRWTRIADYHGGAVERARLVGHPLPVLDEGRRRHGPQDRRLHPPERPQTHELEVSGTVADRKQVGCG